MQIYQRIRDLREDCDKTQKDIADVLGIHQVQYQRYESGKREIPFHMVIELSKYYNVSIDYIAGLTNTKLGLTVSALSKDETALIENFRRLDTLDKGRILERIYMLRS
ncbi:Helix-turn-helix [Ruminococcus sp. YE71]|nr:Helix-turn-helix [Ruminococcus sp. YE78]SFW15673.1 Helix-turn-helix [Ruminococcus sp. YE71]